MTPRAYPDASVCMMKGLFPVGSPLGPVLKYKILQMVEGLCTIIGPEPLMILTREIVERACDVGEVWDKGSVEVAEA